MNTARTLRDMATLFLALGDGTRLRVLNLMRHGEICVSAFTDVLSQSQPKVSRHLAYLRNAGLVEARRDGKWMHYSLAAGLDDKTRLLLHELFKWMEDQDALQKDTRRYEATGHETHFQAFLPLSLEPVEPEPAVTAAKPRKRRSTPKPVEIEYTRPAVEAYYEPEPTRDDYPSRHNELEDFLL
ncbi:MAG TPA: metalloregulator ArsR/SmtB family transcription factor [Pyrinomonadaceae bacterium]|nr:metalloregulator ArsR/SmtB family transcription factor [Pyrinomonadaceae bacterium]